MEGKIKVQRANIVKFIAFCEEILASDGGAIGYFEAKEKIIESLWAKIDKANDELVEGVTSEVMVTEGPGFQKSVSAMADEYQSAFKMFDKVYIQICTVKGKLTKEQTAPTQPLTLPEKLIVQSENPSNIKLKPIDIPVFSGEYTKWISFKNMFESLVHDNKEVKSLQKFHYLKSCLSGEAERVISQFNISEEAYVPAYEAIKDRFHNEVILVDSHIVSIMSQPDLTTESSQGLKEMMDVTTENLRALESLNIDTSSWDPFLLLLLVQKLDDSTRSLWEQKLEPKVRPTIKQFMAFLANRFHALGCQQKFKFSMNMSAVRPNQKHFSYDKRSQGSSGFRSRSEETLFPARTHQSFHNSTEAFNKCPFRCIEPHEPLKCDRYLKADARTRFDLATCAKLCKNCLKNHRGKCLARSGCSQCNDYHHDTLHLERLAVANVPNLNAAVPTNTETNLQSHHAQIDEILKVAQLNKTESATVAWDEQVLLATAIVLVKSNRDNKFYAFRALLDQASEASYASELLVQTLGLMKQNVLANTTGLTGTVTGKIKHVVDLEVGSKQNPAFSINIQAPVVSKITNPLPSSYITEGNWQHIKDLPLADPQYDVPARIDLLLGSPVYGSLLLPGLAKASRGEPVAQNTEFGWVLMGPVRKSPNQHSISTFHLKIDIDRQLRRFFEQEGVSKERIQTQEEVASEKFFMETYKRKEDGRFVVALPFKVNPDKLGSSKRQAISRLTSLERRFRSNKTLQQEYESILQEYEDLGHTTCLGTLSDQEHVPSYYLPHHVVFKPTSTTTKTRIVFDASAKSAEGLSLNDMLMTGPTLQQDLIVILLRWRTHRFAFAADIGKMYRQVEVRDEDRRHQRFLYRKNEDEPIQEYQHNRVTFGVKSATYLAVKSLQQLAVIERRNFPKAAEVVLKDFYMDDTMSGTDTEDESIRMCKDLREMLAKGKFELRKFISNSPKVLATIPEQDRELTLPMEINFDDSVKTLGIHYQPTSDEFHFMVNIEKTNDWPTKRSLLSETSKLFDPLGWLAPVVIKAKMLFQGLWKAGLSWDQGLPEDIAKEWLKIRNEFHYIQQIRINRWIGKGIEAVKIELHGFSDASLSAYAAVVYSRIVNSDGTIQITLLASKTRVAPIEPVTTPRLELCGLVLLADLMEIFKGAMDVEGENIHAWTDSTIVLGWLRTNPARLKTFVANRVVDIHNNFNINQCHFIEGTKNPADCASRGIYPSELKGHSLWWDGPDCLREVRTSWEQNIEIPETTLELKKKVLSTHVISSDGGLEKLFERYSSFERLVKITAICLKFLEMSKSTNKSRITALCLTFINKLRAKTQKPQLIITFKDLKKAEKRIVKLCQGADFNREIHHLSNKQLINKKSNILSLNPFLDINGCLRVGGRLTEANTSYERKHPLILAPGRIANLIIEDMHKKSMHGGIKLTMNLVRERFWIINLRNQVKKHISSCVKCCRFKKEAGEQLMADLPWQRVHVSSVFSHVGLDYAGPFNIKASNVRSPPIRIKPIIVNGEVKKAIPKVPIYEGYIAVFVCLATKAVHLEIVSDKTTDAFLAAFDRFAGRRGLPECCYSDNGLTFVGARPILAPDKENSLLDFDIVNNHVTKNGTDWKFITPRAPNQGGLWEAAVKSMKHHLKRIVGVMTLTYEEMSTVLARIEAILNSRPLCTLNDDLEDLSALTPGHFLIGRPLISRPDSYSGSRNVGIRERWHLVQKIQNEFWKSWSNEYLNELQTRQKWCVQQRNFQPGDLVLLKEDDLPSMKWPLARIVAVYPSKDKNVRTVKIRLTNNSGKVVEWLRPINKLILLPVNQDEEREKVSE